MNKLLRPVNKLLKAPQKIRIRAEVPEAREDNLKGYLHKGFSVEFIEEWQGQEVSEDSVTSDIWYKDKNGDFYWSGGFGIASPPVESSFMYSDYLDTLSGFGQLKDIDCSEITIAVLDSGINLDLEDLNSALITSESKDYIDEDSLEDLNGHGSHVSGIICGRGEGVFGLAKNSNLITHKIMTKTGVVVSGAVNASLNDLSQKNSVQIINMSFNMDVAEYDAMNTLCKQLSDSGKILVAAANEYDSQLLQGAFVPAYSDNVISVGVFSNEIFENTLSEIHSSFDYLMPKTSFYSTEKKPQNYGYKSGSSMNCAFVSGLIAMLLAENPSMDMNDIRNALDQNSTPFNELTIYSDKPKLYKNETN